RTSRTVAGLALLAGAAGVVAYSTTALSADHQDSPTLLSTPTADINDVYTWMDGSNVVLAMTAYPGAHTGARAGTNPQYGFHTGSGSSILAPPPSKVDVIATFDSSTPQKIKLWVGTAEYVTGDPSPANGLASSDGKVKVFAGLRADP